MDVRTLPIEVWTVIIKKIDVKSLFLLSCVSPFFLTLTSSDDFWERFFTAKERKKKLEAETWKQFYLRITKQGIKFRPTIYQNIRKRTPQEEYATIIALVGSNRMRVSCFDSVVRMCTIPSKFLIEKSDSRKRMAKNKVDLGLVLRAGDLVLITKFDHNKNKEGELVHRYDDNEAQLIRSLPEFKKRVPDKVVEKGAIDLDNL
eukprot:TRINITY_DN26135_c0_g1_i1.p1 TRINITY_DN26135_c0_g1~~TRINITY_DN26135_c0_g1_i1.p1  ORF type:complete len:203 (+),score=43.45 TRINITY_DN26135_c0_g1_i1:81-689(+)